MEILATSIGSNTFSYFANPTTVAFKSYPEHKTASEPSSGLPVVTFTRLITSLLFSIWFLNLFPIETAGFDQAPSDRFVHNSKSNLKFRISMLH